MGSGADPGLLSLPLLRPSKWGASPARATLAPVGRWLPASRTWVSLVPLYAWEDLSHPPLLPGATGNRQRTRQGPRALPPPYPSSSASKRTLNLSLGGREAFQRSLSSYGQPLQPAPPSFPSLKLHTPARTCFVLARTTIPACLSATTLSTPQARPGTEGGFVYVWEKEEGGK